jgi:hypothetical protein
VFIGILFLILDSYSVDRRIEPVQSACLDMLPPLPALRRVDESKRRERLMNHQTTYPGLSKQLRFLKLSGVFQTTITDRGTVNLVIRSAGFKVARLYKSVKLEPRQKEEIELGLFL